MANPSHVLAGVHAFKLCQIFNTRIQLLNASRLQKRILSLGTFCVLQIGLGCRATQLAGAVGIVFHFILTSIITSNLFLNMFQTKSTYEQPFVLSFAQEKIAYNKTIFPIEIINDIIAKVARDEDPITRFKMLSQAAKSSRTLSDCFKLRSFKAIADNFPNLTFLDISFCKVRNQDVQYIATHLTNLKYLNISGGRASPTPDYTPLKQLKNLVELKVAFVHNAFLNDIATECLHLKSLDINYSTIDTLAIQTNAAKLKRLTYLNLFGCPLIVDLQPVKTQLPTTEVVSKKVIRSLD